MSSASDPIAGFIARWQASAAAERANYQLFLSELCDLLGVPPPEPTTGDPERNAYVFERDVTFEEGDGTTTTGRIDLYKRACFVLEAKQGSDAEQSDAEDALLSPGVHAGAAGLAAGAKRRKRGSWAIKWCWLGPLASRIDATD
jgi:hypothetical protein